MLSSGAHVQIGDIEYMLDRSKPEPYRYTPESLFAQTTAIAGEVAKQQLRPEKILWYNTDWSAGEGFKIYYPQEPARYDQSSLMNVSNAGLITTRAKRRRSLVTRIGTTATTANRPAGGSAWNKAVIAWGNEIIYSTDAVTWSRVANSLALTGYSYFDADTDGRYLVVGTTVEGASANIFNSIDASPLAPTGVDIYSGTTAVNPPEVNEILEGQVYSWNLSATNVLQLSKGAGANAANAFSTVIYNSGFVATGSWGTDFWTDIEAAESSLYMSLGTPGGSVVFESRQDVGRPFWTSPPGFTIKKLLYHAGVLFCVGSQTAAGKRFGAVWAIPLSTRSPIFIASPRRHRNEELFEWTIACPGYGNSIFLADANSGKIFCYDIARESLWLFDDLANGGSGDGTSFTPGEGGNLLPSIIGSFEGGTLALSGWTTEAPGFAWNVTTPARTGLSALGAPAIGAAFTSLVSTASGVNGISVAASTSYTLSYYVRVASSFSGATITPFVRWYDVTGALLSTSTGTGVGSATIGTGTYALKTDSVSSPVGAAFGQVGFDYTTSGVSVGMTVDDVSLALSSGATTSKLAFLAMHGSRLFGAIYEPAGTATSLQVLSWDDNVKENRDGSQPVSATQDSSEWDLGVPQELKALNGVYVTYEVTDGGTNSGLVEDSRITISYAVDGDIFLDSFTELETITSDTVVPHKGRYFMQASDDNDTLLFSRIKFRLTLDNNGSSTVQPPIVYIYVPEAQLMAYSEVWDLVVRLQDENDNERPTERELKAWQLRDNINSLSANKQYVNFKDGVAYAGVANMYSEHTVQIEDPIVVIENVDTGEGYAKVRLRAVPV